MTFTLPSRYKCPNCGLVLYPPEAKNPHTNFIANKTITCPRCNSRFRWKENHTFLFAKYGLLIFGIFIPFMIFLSFLGDEYIYYTIGVSIVALVSIITTLFNMCYMEFEIVSK
jgi:DNA-directed RNA polymerase subunit RPC12/RpoP